MSRNSSPLWEMTKCRWREFRREPSAFFFVIFMPVLWMLLLGGILAAPPTDRWQVGVISGVESTDLLEEILVKDDRIKARLGDEDDVEGWFKKGDVDLVVDFRSNREIVLELDPRNRVSRHAQLGVTDLLQAAAGRVDPLKVTAKDVDRPGSRYIDFLIPGLLALTIFSTSLFGTGMTLVVNRRDNLLKRYWTTPMRPSQYILSHVIGRMIILVVEFLVVIASGYFLFDFEVKGGIHNLFLFSVAAAAMTTAMAMLCGSRIANASAMTGLTQLIFLPLMILCGIWFSRSGYPQWMQTVTDFLPLSPIADGLRLIALEGAHLGQVGLELGLIGVYFLVFAFLTKLAFKWY